MNVESRWFSLWESPGARKVDTREGDPALADSYSLPKQFGFFQCRPEKEIVGSEMETCMQISTCPVGNNTNIDSKKGQTRHWAIEEVI